MCIPSGVLERSKTRGTQEWGGYFVRYLAPGETNFLFPSNTYYGYGEVEYAIRQVQRMETEPIYSRCLLEAIFFRWRIEEGQAKLVESRSEYGFLPATFSDDQSKSQPNIEELVAKREGARREKNFTLADNLRKQAASLGYVLEDRPDGTSSVRKL